jgi:cyanophycin synthetase
MYIVDIRAIEGPNIYSSKNIIKMILNVKDLENVTTKSIAGFNETLVRLLPGLMKHNCCFDMPGGFLFRLEEGTYFPHVIEHVAIELLNLAGQDVSFGKARRMENANYVIVFEYKVLIPALEAAELAVTLVQSILYGNQLDLSSNIKQLEQMTIDGQLGPSTAAIADEARKRGIPVIRFGTANLVILGYGAHKKRIKATLSEHTGCIAADLACDKIMTKKLLYIAGIPVPTGEVVRSENEALRAAARLGYPVVIKPHDGNKGKGVSLNLKNDCEIKKAFQLAAEHSSEIIVEKHINGRHYRVLVVNGHFVCASERIPAHVIGDGEHSISRLVEIENNNPLRGYGHEKPLTKIKMDAVVDMVLSRHGYTKNSVPPKDELVYLRENGNLSTGGIAVDVTDTVCLENRLLAERAAAVIGLDIAGIDITTKDISMPVNKCMGAVIEVNAAPGIRMHHYPSCGKPQPAAQAIVDMLFPHGASRFPLVAVTGTNGKTTTVRMIKHMLSLWGLNVGITSTDGVYIGETCIKKGDCSGPESARMVLFDPAVEAAVLEVARGGLIKGGLAYEQADVGIITNITGDHLGQDGVFTLDDLIFVKSLVIEQIKPDGYAILNADDKMSVEAGKRSESNKIFFSMRQDNIVLRKHLINGGKGVCIKDGAVCFQHENDTKVLIRVKDIASSMGGKARHNIQNALAAAACGWALGIPQNVIGRALKEFRCNTFYNPGRMNMFEMENFTVMLDYGHNVASLESIINTVKPLKPSRLAGVIASPGDRRDQDIVELGKVAGKGFNRLIIKEDEQLRGRRPGEVASLLLRGALISGMKREKTDIILNEREAIAFAMENAVEGDLIVIFYEKYEESLETIKKCALKIKHISEAAKII